MHVLYCFVVHFPASHGQSCQEVHDGTNIIWDKNGITHMRWSAAIIVWFESMWFDGMVWWHFAIKLSGLNLGYRERERDTFYLSWDGMMVWLVNERIISEYEYVIVFGKWFNRWSTSGLTRWISGFFWIPWVEDGRSIFYHVFVKRVFLWVDWPENYPLVN